MAQVGIDTVPGSSSGRALCVFGGRPGELTPMGEAAYALKLFVDGMPELSEDVMAPMVNTHAEMVQAPLPEVSTRTAVHSRGRRWHAQAAAYT